jgi:hypothetical protein
LDLLAALARIPVRKNGVRQTVGHAGEERPLHRRVEQSDIVAFDVLAARRVAAKQRERLARGLDRHDARARIAKRECHRARADIRADVQHARRRLHERNGRVNSALKRLLRVPERGLGVEGLEIERLERRVAAVPDMQQPRLLDARLTGHALRSLRGVF